MDALPVFSVVTPSFNQAIYLKAAIESVLAQDYTKVEYIVMDGGSTDDSQQILHRYAERLAEWVSEPDGGQADAIQRGWQASKGEILAWLNSDDVYLPGAFTAVAWVFQEHPEIDVVSGDCVVIDREGNWVRDLPGGEFGLANLSGNSLPQPGVFCRRVAVESVGGVKTDLKYVMDWELWLRMWLKGCRFYHLASPVAQFRDWEGSKTNTRRLGFAQERCQVYKEILNNNDITTVLKAKIQSAYHGSILEICLAYWVQGAKKPAGEFLRANIASVGLVEKGLPSADALGLLLADSDQDIARTTDEFCKLIAQVNCEKGVPSFEKYWQAQISAEAYLVKAWQATFARMPARAAHYFGMAISAYPQLIFEHRVLSPWVNSLLAGLR